MRTAKIKYEVKTLLAECELARNDHSLAYVELLRRFYPGAILDLNGRPFIFVADRAVLPKEPTVTRWIRFFQSRGDYPPTDPVVRARRGRAEKDCRRQFRK